MDKLPIGQQVTVTLKFRAPYPQFPAPPAWDLYDPNGNVVLTGVSTIGAVDPNGWDCTLTVPETYQSQSDNDIMMLELYGTTIEGVVKSVDRSYELMDAADDFLPSVVLCEDSETIEDSLILDRADIPASAFSVIINDYLGLKLSNGVGVQIASIKRVANRTDVPDRFTEHTFRGYRYDLEIPGIKFPIRTYAAYQLKYKINSNTPAFKQTEIHPLIRVNSRWYDYIFQLKFFLDQARLIEIDPTLQWRQEELAQALINGINYVNTFPSVITFWTVDDAPLPLSEVLIKSAAFYALNRRYLAEGFNAFDFNGLSTQLTMDRREAITYKIEEIKAFLDTNLTLIKSIAIATYGKGTPDPSVTNAQKESRVVLRTQPSPVHNRYGTSYGAASTVHSARIR
ncbi:hypothetical protein [Rhizobium phage RHph_N46]|nr:hypothetical protein [Rhizobium phage RHph_N46]